MSARRAQSWRGLAGSGAGRQIGSRLASSVRPPWPEQFRIATRAMPARFAVRPLPIRARRCFAALLAVLAVVLVPPPGASGRAVPSLGDGGDSLAGRLVVATESMGDPRFQNTVIYMVEHNADGAMGLIVNVPFGTMPLVRLFEHLGLEGGPEGGLEGGPEGDLEAAEVAGEIEVYYGGPVEPERGFLLHSAEVVMEGLFRLLWGLPMV